tara:strand:+ start:1465 stop:3576 length:2112 start_codon:yes stop_codon:yes gene_type:complete
MAKEKYKGEAQAKAVRKYFADVQKELNKYGGNPLVYRFEKGETLTKMVDKLLTAPPEIKEMYVNELKSDYDELLPLFKQRDKARKEMGMEPTSRDSSKVKKSLDSIKESDKLKFRTYVRSDPIGKIKIQRDYGKKFKDTINKATEGLKDGGTPMKNDPPVGSTPSEVADDIPAMISEGEFVIPADVVRYVGLDKIRAMMQEAKHGLACMEDEGLIVDVDEEGRPQEDQKEKSDDKVAIIETVQIEKVDPMMTQMAEGGMTDKDSPVSSPILNPENKPVMAEGGMVIGPDGSLRMAMQEGGMPMQMEDMMMEEMPSEEPEMAMPPELANEMAPQEAEPMPEAPMMNAPVAQEFNGVPHLMAYLQEDEIKALQEAGRGLDENGEQMLSPEGIPVFYGGDVGSEHGGTNDPGQGPGGTNDPGQGPDASAPAAPASPAGPDNEVGDFGGSSEDENEPKLSKKIKEELDPDKDDNDKTYVSGVGFIDKYIENRLNNPLQGKPAYAVATVAGGGLMRNPDYVTMHQGGTTNTTNNNEELTNLQEAYRGQFGPIMGFNRFPPGDPRNEDAEFSTSESIEEYYENLDDPSPSVEGGMMSPPEPAPQQGFYSGEQGQNFLDIIGGLDLGNQEDMREKFKGSLKKYDDGSYDIEQGSELAAAISNFRNAEGDSTDPQNAVYIKGDKKGQPIDNQTKGFLTESAIERITDDYAE